jgi:hypothetical protein
MREVFRGIKFAVSPVLAAAAAAAAAAKIIIIVIIMKVHIK